jgi:hypothetical protein
MSVHKGEERARQVFSPHYSLQNRPAQATGLPLSSVVSLQALQELPDIASAQPEALLNHGVPPKASTKAAIRSATYYYTPAVAYSCNPRYLPAKAHRKCQASTPYNAGMTKARNPQPKR